MSVGTLLLLVLISVVISIAIGYKLNTNIGVIAMVFAYIIGCFIMNIKISNLVLMWPTKIAFMLMTITFFYGYAVENGTLKMMADHMLYKTKNVTWALPITIWVICFVLAGIGAGAPAVTAFMTPLGMVLALRTGMNPLLIAIAVSTGSVTGSNLPFSQGGVIVRGLIEQTTFANNAIGMTVSVAANSFIANFLVFMIAYFILKGYKNSNIDIEKPAAPTAVQKKNLVIIILTVIAIVLPVIINLVAKNPVTVTMAKYFDIQMIAIVGAALCAILKLGNERSVIKNQIPWNTIVMLGGISMLMAVASEAGAVKLMASWVGTNVPASLVGVALTIIAGFMSLFAGAITVVTPMLVPIVQPIASATGLSPTMMISAILIGSCFTGISPFSTGGSLLLSGCTDEKLREKLFYNQIAAAAIFLVYTAILAFIGVYSIFG